MVMVSRGTGRAAGQPLYDRLWGSGFLPSRYQGVKLRSGADPVLYLSNPGGWSSTTRREVLDDLKQLNIHKHQQVGDPEILSRIEQYELAFRMQTAVPELTDISSEPQHILDMYGPDVHRARERMPATACWPAGWPNAMCVSCSSIIWAGTNTTICPITCPNNAAMSIRLRLPC